MSADGVKERPIFFSAPMVKAILEGRKTQTRRIVKCAAPDLIDADGWPLRDDDGTGGEVRCACPYGVPGDRLWVRETLGVPGHMPRWASRITLELTDVRVQRLREISEEDAVAEGCVAGSSVTHRGTMGPFDAEVTREASTAREAFCALWNSINIKRAPWHISPWVWALTFRRVT
jgi:hypothetical protein